MTFTFTSARTPPKGYTQVRFVEGEARALIREGALTILEVGVGKRKDVTRRKYLTLVRAVVRTAKAQHIERIALYHAELQFPQLTKLPSAELAMLTATNMQMANFEFSSFKTKKNTRPLVTHVCILGTLTKAERDGYDRGSVIAVEVNAARELSNTPGGHLTPRKLADAAKKAARGLPITVTTMGKTEIKKLGMGLLAGVGEGSPNEPTFTVMKYTGGKKAEKPIVLIGKGITFDSGGLNLKPSASIYEMHMDMSGAAAVIHTITLAARLKLKKNVIALVPSAENLVGPHATRPGDIHTSLSGKTVEITDTDAEGRLVLADAITYAKRFKPSLIIDAATLTGASLIALGNHVSGLMTQDNALARLLERLGEETGEYVWRLPLWEEYESVVKSEFADLQNHSISQGRYGGATNGAVFLLQFSKEIDAPWAHLDIAPRMTSTQGDELAKGAAGAPIRLLIRCIEEWNKN